MSFLIKNDEVWEKYKDIWDIIKNKLGIKFHSEPIYKKKYLKAKVREFDDDVKIYFLHIACITIDSVMRINKNIIHKFI